MKNFIKKILLTIIINQLLCTPSPLVQMSLASDADNDDYISNLKENCTGASQQWDEEKNSCVSSKEAEEAKEMSDACKESDDPTSCYKNSAKELTNLEEAQKENWFGDGFRFNDYKKTFEATGITIGALYILFGIIAYIVKVDPSHSVPCHSKLTLGLTSLAWIAGDSYIRYVESRKLYDLAKRYESRISDSAEKESDLGSYQAQVLAFEYLKAEQEKIKDLADKRMKLQMAITAGLALAIYFSIQEMVTMTHISCLPSRKTYEEVNNEQAQENLKGLKESEASAKEIQAAQARATQTSKALEASQKSASSTSSTAPSSLEKFLNNTGTSLTNLITAGVMLIFNAFLIKFAWDEKKKASANISSVNDVIASYKEYMAGFCPKGRDDIGSPNCYCYNDDGSQNSSRTKSATCQNLFALNSTDYSLQNESEQSDGKIKGCITVTGKYDPNCRCQKMKNTTTGENACANTSSLSTNLLGAASSLGLKGGINATNALTNGASTALGNLNSASLKSAAGRANKMAFKMIDQAKEKGQSLPNSQQLLKMAKKLAKAQERKGKSSSSLLALRGGSSAGTRPASVSAALKKAGKTKALSAKLNKLMSSLSGGKGAIGSSQKKKKFDFVWNEEASSSPHGQVQTFMDKKYKYKNSDIVDRKDVSLWKVISNRYQVSGLKRLFSEEK